MDGPCHDFAGFECCGDIKSREKPQVVPRQQGRIPKLLRVARQPAVARATTSCPRALKNRIALEVAWSRLALTEPALASVAAIRESGARCKYGVGATLRLQLP